MVKLSGSLQAAQPLCKSVSAMLEAKGDWDACRLKYGAEDREAAKLKRLYFCTGKENTQRSCYCSQKGFSSDGSERRRAYRVKL